MSKHGLPWKYQENADAYTHIIRDANYHIAVSLRQTSDPREKEKALMVVKACNNFDELVACCRLIVETISDDIVLENNVSEDKNKLLERAKKALKSAEVE